MLNATRRSSLTDPEPLTPGEVYELELEIDTTAWRFPRGHRIRLAIASADWPNVWPTPEPATNTVHRGAERPSRLVLPTVPPDGSATPPAFLPSPRSLERHSDRIDPPVWQVVHDVLGGRSQVRIEESRDDRIDETTVVGREYSLVADVHPGQPRLGERARAAQEPHHAPELGDGGQLRRAHPGHGHALPRHDRPRAARQRDPPPLGALAEVGAAGSPVAEP